MKKLIALALATLSFNASALLTTQEMEDHTWKADMNVNRVGDIQMLKDQLKEIEALAKEREMDNKLFICQPMKLGGASDKKLKACASVHKFAKNYRTAERHIKNSIDQLEDEARQAKYDATRNECLQTVVRTDRWNELQCFVYIDKVEWVWE